MAPFTLHEHDDELMMMLMMMMVNVTYICMKDRNWEILEVSRARVDQFRRTVPLITDLKNPAMRQRHWDQVQVQLLF